VDQWNIDRASAGAAQPPGKVEANLLEQRRDLLHLIERTLGQLV